MYGTSTLTTKGQVTIPQDLRLMLGVQSGDQVFFESIPNQKTIKLKKAHSVVEELAGSLRSKVKFTTHAAERRAVGKYLAQKYRQSFTK